MRVGEICNREVVYVEQGASVGAAARMMREHHVGDLVVVEVDEAPRRPIGILTDRDLVVSALAQDPEDIARLLVGDLVSRTLVTITEETDMSEALRLMRVHGIRRLPVIGAGDELVGLLTFDDVVECLAEQLSDLALISTSQRRREEKLRP
ncbi:MAG: CBS domain-containing protein [Myxococcales bacterium]|nr:CBS domain-containing protein [Myxococcales bacterium]MCB9704015.1 CBS domain-containing protein [Myxococcales bacterium]